MKTSIALIALVACALFASAHAGVTIDVKTPGDGKNFPKKGDSISVHYTGTVRLLPLAFPLSLSFFLLSLVHACSSFSILHLSSILSLPQLLMSASGYFGITLHTPPQTVPSHTCPGYILTCSLSLSLLSLSHSLSLTLFYIYSLLLMARSSTLPLTAAPPSRPRLVLVMSSPAGMKA
eukprot:TRINITY_DN1273_c0_g5_i1.p1 TRINITY_DN1273_c0_g5~~TRINITY_DN1273_c0_g5_i1.p1  ORF type:complete len:178 (+),score=28.21 TRINITY_DN1273_c0_g5_i1:199-732(+)